MTAIAAAYDVGAGAWRSGPERVYGALARTLVAAAGGPLGGLRALDAGTGGGAVARALAAAGADVVGVDRAPGQLRTVPADAAGTVGAADRPGGAGGAGRPAAGRAPGVVGDVLRLPVRSAAVDLAAAGFVLNHLDRPADGLRELARVTRPGGRVLTSTFVTGTVEPVKAVLESVAAGFGWTPPEWYEHLKRVAEPQVSDPVSLGRVAAAAGLAGEILQRVVPVELTAAQAVDWRLGMPSMAPFVAGLPPRRRSALLCESSAALGHAPLTLRLPVLVLRGRV